MKSDYLERRIRLNRTTTAVVKSKKDKEGDFYHNSLTIVHEYVNTDPLNFATRAELEDAIANIDTTADQLGLGFNVTIGGDNANAEN